MSSNKNLGKNYAFLFLVSGLVILLDQLSKAYIRANFHEYEMWAPWDWLLPYARITHVTNTGASFGMFQGFGGVFTVLAFIVAIAIIYYFPRVADEDWTLRLAMSLQLGGAVGNLIDRVTLGWVTDFISVGNFPVFNIADSSITIGVVVLIVGVWLQERREKERQSQAVEEHSIDTDTSAQDSNASS